MQSPVRIRPLAAAILLAGAAPAAAQEDVTDLFDRGPFYEAAGVLRGEGEIPFYADVSFLAGPGDSTQTLLGIALSNSTFQFVKESGGYRARYEVELRLEGPGGGFRNTWREEVRVGTFDETTLDRETVVFQSAFSLLPGTYDLTLEVRDTQGGNEASVESSLEVPAIEPPASGFAVSDPVLVRFFGPAREGGDRDYVLYPSHYFDSAPREISFLIEIYRGASATAVPARLEAVVTPDSGGPAVSQSPIDIPPLAQGSARVYGAVPGRGVEAGLYRLTTTLRDSAGQALAESSTRISVSAVTQWVEENWEDALELLAYEATDDEREALEATQPTQRLEAWNEFWRVRDPAPATPANEAFEQYFRRIAVANANFSTKLRPGWKSDRGRVYVAFGAPTDVIRRPVNSRTLPLEIWVYDNPGFEIVFEDRIGFGNYQIANPGTFANELSALERRKHRAIAERRAQADGGAGEVAPADSAPGETGAEGAVAPDAVEAAGT
jgi:GWxTD domain-containing protein